MGALAACFVALNPLHIMTSQHIADPNLLALLFVLLAALAMVRIVEERGLATGSRPGREGRNERRGANPSRPPRSPAP